MSFSNKKNPITLPADYDYIGCYLVDHCFLSCPYCITDHNGTGFTSGKENKFSTLSVDEWLTFFSRLEAPEGIVPTLQGGEPFLYRGIWELIDKSPIPLDILTALPPTVKRKKFQEINLENLNRGAVYPNVRVSYHIGQNKIEDLVPRVAELQDIISIGIYAVAHPAQTEEVERARALCEKAGVTFKTKEFLGYHEGKLYGNYLYPDSCVGEVTRPHVLCRNSVLIVSPAGDVYRCHSDLYHKRHDLKVGNITNPNFEINDEHQDCFFYGMCSECDVKIKNNHQQQFGYTSVDIKFTEEPTKEEEKLTGRDILRCLP